MRDKIGFMLAADSLADRMRMLKRVCQQAREREDRIDLDPRELWEAADEAALDQYEKALAHELGQVFLPLETVE